MPSTAPYVPQHQFGTDTAAQDQIDAAALDTELRLISANIAAILNALGVSIRDDDTLTDLLVRIRNLHPELSTYLQSAISGTIATQSLNYHYPVVAATTANVVTPYGLQTIDGVALAEGDRVLLKDQTIANQNGIWVVHDFGGPVPSGLWTRDTDLPAGLPCGSGWGVVVRGGTINGGTVWAIVAGGAGSQQPVVGTDPLAFFSIFGVFPVPISKGGTGASTAAAAADNLGLPTKAVGTITGDGVTTLFYVTHNLNTENLIAGFQGASGAGADLDDWSAVDMNRIAVQFVTPPALGEAITVTMIG